jgi:hypothetical protein
MKVVLFDGNSSKIYKVTNGIGDLQMILEPETPEELAALQRLAKAVPVSEWTDEIVGNDDNPLMKFFLESAQG